MYCCVNRPLLLQNLHWTVKIERPLTVTKKAIDFQLCTQKNKESLIRNLIGGGDRI